MCTPSIPQDTSAQQAATAAAQRQAAVTQGQSAIDSAFSKFDDNYFKDYSDAYTANYDPQVDEQYGIAKQKLGYNAARAGVQDSTPAFTAEDRLNTSYGKQRQQIAAGALDATNQLKNNVASQKSNLYALNSSAADPTLASERATAAAGTIPSTPQYSVLGDLFGNLVNSGASYVAGQNKALPPGYASVFQAGSGLPGNSSGRVVR